MHDLYAFETLAADPVVNRDGEELGELEHLMVEVPSGRIAYGVLGHGGVFGIGDTLYAVPWSALSFDERHGRFVLDITRQRLERAPRFDRDHWPATDPRWASEVHQYFSALSGDSTDRAP